MTKTYTCYVRGRMIALFLICWYSGVCTLAQAPVRAMEYFLDTDPGRGKATKVSLTAGTDIDVEFAIETAGLSPGLHLLGVRGYSGTSWSQTYVRFITLAPASIAIEGIEYFWDTDPGIGKATHINSSTQGADATIDLNLLYEGLPAGLHTVGIRARSNGVWSQTYCHTVMISTSAAPVETIEYYWDVDPGKGKATPIDCQAEGENVTIDFDAICSELSPGIHLLGIRAGSYGVWSNTYTRTVAVYPTGNPYEEAEYFWDTDPGRGKGQPLAMTLLDGYALVDVENIPFDELSGGSHTLFIRAKAAGAWSHVHTQTVFINGTIGFTLPKETVCVGETFTVTNTSEGTHEDTTFRWDMDSDGTPESDSATTFEYSYAAPGEYEIKLTAKLGDQGEASCVKTITVLSNENPTVMLRPSASKFCPEDVITIVAEVVNGGETPVFEWYRNDVVIEGETAEELIIRDPKHNDAIRVKATSSLPCCNNPEATSEAFILIEDVLPDASLAHYFPVYTTENPYQLTGGTPEGGTYRINDEDATTFNPAAYAPGNVKVSYRVINENDCYNEAIRFFELRAPGSKSMLLGDVNKDETIDVYDVLCLVDLVYDAIYPTHTLRTADINGDIMLNVSDVVGVASIILNAHGDPLQTRAAKMRSINTTNILTANHVVAEPGSKAAFNITLTNEAWVSGAQFEITLPEGVELSSASADVIVGRTPNRADNTYTVLAYTLSLKQLPEQLPLMLTLPESIAPGEYPLEPRTVVLADRQMDNVVSKTESGVLSISLGATPTGTDRQTSEVRLYDENRNIVIAGAEGAEAYIYDSAGRAVANIPALAKTEWIAVTQGSYVVKIVKDNRTVEYKIMIK